MIEILIIGSSGLDSKNNSTNNRMVEIFRKLALEYEYNIDYYKLREAKLKVPFITYLKNKEDDNILHALSLIFKNKKNYDLIIGESFKGAIIAYLFSFLRPTKFVWRQFGSTFNDEITQLFYLNPRKLIKFIFHKLIVKSRNLSAVICTEDGCANHTLYIDKLKLSEKKFFLIKNQRTEINTKKIRPTSTFSLLIIGRISKWKKIHCTLKALNIAVRKDKDLSKEFKLDIIGLPSDVNYANDLNMLVKQFNFENKVTFYENLDLNEISEKLSKSSLSISLTAYNPIIESLQNKTPVITYDYGEVFEIFGRNPAVSILGKSIRKSSDLTQFEEKMIVDELAIEILNMYERRDQLIEIGELGFNQLVNDFPTLEQHVDEICDIYNKIANS